MHQNYTTVFQLYVCLCVIWNYYRRS